MSLETLHYDALIGTARLDLDRAHRAARAGEAAEIRRGLQLAIDALRDAAAAATGPEVVPSPATAARIGATLQTALTDLDRGTLAELGSLLEKARKELGC